MVIHDVHTLGVRGGRPRRSVYSGKSRFRQPRGRGGLDLDPSPTKSNLFGSVLPRYGPRPTPPFQDTLFGDHGIQRSVFSLFVSPRGSCGVLRHPSSLVSPTLRPLHRTTVPSGPGRQEVPSPFTPGSLTVPPPPRTEGAVRILRRTNHPKTIRGGNRTKPRRFLIDGSRKKKYAMSYFGWSVCRFYSGCSGGRYWGSRPSAPVESSRRGTRDDVWEGFRHRNRHQSGWDWGVVVKWGLMGGLSFEWRVVEKGQVLRDTPGAPGD